jgi:hypothetical protein
MPNRSLHWVKTVRVAAATDAAGRQKRWQNDNQAVVHV